MDLKELKKIIALAKKSGAVVFKYNGLELVFEPGSIPSLKAPRQKTLVPVEIPEKKEPSAVPTLEDINAWIHQKDEAV